MFDHNSYAFMRSSSDKLREFYDLKAMLVCITMRNIAKKCLGNRLVKNLHDAYYNVVYSFANHKLNKLLRLASFRHIFKHFFESGDFDKMMKSDVTLEGNSEIYKSTADKMLQSIHIFN